MLCNPLCRSKLAVGLLSGRYSQQQPKNEEVPANKDDGAPAKEAKPKVGCLGAFLY